MSDTQDGGWTSRHVIVDGYAVHVRCFDHPERHTDLDHRIYLLLHGATASAAFWKPWAERIAVAGASVWAVDFRGHGQSSGHEDIGAFSVGHYRDDALAVLKELVGQTGRRPIVVGHSMGGLIAQLVADELSDEVHKLILIGSAPPHGIFMKFWDNRWRVFRFLKPKYIINFLLNRPLKMSVEEMKQFALDKGVVHDMDGLIACTSPESGRALTDIALGRYGVHGNYKGPVLSVIGTNDDVVHADVQHQIAKKYGAHKIVYEGGHLPQYERHSEKLFNQIRHWVVNHEVVTYDDEAQ